MSWPMCANVGAGKGKGGELGVFQSFRFTLLPNVGVTLRTGLHFPLEF